MGMHAGLGLGLALHDGEVRLGLAGALARARELVAVEIDETHLLGRHEAFRDERRRAQHEIVADAHGDVAAVAVDVVLGPDAAADVADPLLERLDGGRIEEPLDLGGRLRIAARAST